MSPYALLEVFSDRSVLRALRLVVEVVVVSVLGISGASVVAVLPGDGLGMGSALAVVSIKGTILTTILLLSLPHLR